MGGNPSAAFRNWRDFTSSFAPSTPSGPLYGAAFWKGLPEDPRGELSAILAEATGKAHELAAGETEADRKRIGEAGVAIILGLTSDEREARRKATADVEKRFAGRGRGGPACAGAGRPRPLTLRSPPLRSRVVRL